MLCARVEAGELQGRWTDGALDMRAIRGVASLFLIISLRAAGSGVNDHRVDVIVDATVLSCDAANALALQRLIVSGAAGDEVVRELPAGSVVVARLHRTRVLTWSTVVIGSVESLSAWRASKEDQEHRFFVPSASCGQISNRRQSFITVLAADAKCGVEPGAEICHLRQDRVLRLVPEEFCVDPAI